MKKGNIFLVIFLLGIIVVAMALNRKAMQNATVKTEVKK